MITGGGVVFVALGATAGAAVVAVTVTVTAGAGATVVSVATPRFAASWAVSAGSSVMPAISAPTPHSSSSTTATTPATFGHDRLRCGAGTYVPCLGYDSVTRGSHFRVGLNIHRCSADRRTRRPRCALRRAPCKIGRAHV